ncbi:hypothetical protein [Paenibacillus abyssi]|uniref:Flagellar hook-length control protein-like C-terminal domain-containing protein n=1 Tax=Paenibacillus abyssi TaxID=1340531 RepID=A0A917D6Z0_9BACL|nr:hypothetical protein [Paenibacillus abyssi]GGG12529.1 hypothetical protein GCM10010916_31800 [Paenibacillus abyssi]
MNIGQLMRGLLREPQPSESRSLELKVGQIVSGVILEVMEGQDALVQINGTQVRAKLEIPLLPGQTTMLQVQPESAGGTPLLKPVDLSAANVRDETLRDLAKNLGMPDKKWALELVRDMRREGFQLNRELGQAMGQAQSAMPANADAEQWMHAAATAFKRGLPVTGTTIAALQQAMFGQPSHELMEGVQTQLKALIGGTNETAPALKDVNVRNAALRLQALLDEGAVLLRTLEQAAEQPAAAKAGASSAPEAGGRVITPAQLQQAAQPPVQTAAQPNAGQASAGQGAAAGAAGAAAAGSAAGTDSGAVSTSASGPAAAGTSKAGANGWALEVLKWLGVDHERQLTRSAAPGGIAGAAEAAKAGESDSPAGRTASGAEGQAHSAPRPADAPQQPLAERAAVAAERAPGQGLPVPGGAPEAQAADAGRPAAAQESLKSVLLTLAASDEVPPALREAAQQLVQNITGQQLLLTPERNGAMLSHVTMFIPFHGPDGSQTASVHIQSRRGRKGELDAENCRLLFDLKMKQLGDTLVDVQVVDKIVSLNVWNDHPFISSLIESSRQDITEAMGRAGYQLLALRTTPLPEPAEQTTSPSSQQGQSAVQPPDRSSFSSRPYKGVDVRV